MVALLVQGAIALALVGFGALQQDGFEAMVEFTAPVFWFFFLLAGIALFVLRRRAPDAPRPFRVPLYPVMPAIFVRDLRVPALFEPRLRALAGRRTRLPARDGRRRRRLGIYALRGSRWFETLEPATDVRTVDDGTTGDLRTR